MSLIAKPRLDAYRRFFDCKTERELIGAYLWGQAIAGAFQPIVSMYEVSLRNAVHHHASFLSSEGVSTSFPWYDQASIGAFLVKGRSLEKIDALLLHRSTKPHAAAVRRPVQPTPDQVVAALSFGFWPAFLQQLPRSSRQALLFRVFPNHPQKRAKHWGYDANVNNLVQSLRDIQNLRNHIAHHEPIWKASRLTGNERKWEHAVESLRAKHESTLSVLSWCCAGTPVLYKASFGWRCFDHLCNNGCRHGLYE